MASAATTGLSPGEPRREHSFTPTPDALSIGKLKFPRRKLRWSRRFSILSFFVALGRGFGSFRAPQFRTHQQYRM